jgi:uncharacterized protein YlxW (UPF0749 family)
MSVFSAAMRHRSFYWQISILCFVLGGLLAAAVYTSNMIAHAGSGVPIRAGFDYGGQAYVATVTADRVERDSQEIKKLREAKTNLETIIAKGNDGREELNTSLQEARIYAGLTEVTGPGIVVTLQDSKKQPMIGVNPEQYLIHDRDINEVINELRSAGAEAIAVGDQRVVASTAIRCVGPVVMVNEVKEGVPVVIRAIGDPNTMLTALNITNGVLDNIRRYDPIMARADKSDPLRLPGFSGGTQLKYARPVKLRSEHKTQ